MKMEMKKMKDLEEEMKKMKDLEEEMKKMKDLEEEMKKMKDLEEEMEPHLFNTVGIVLVIVGLGIQIIPSI
jgi:hypothetical protein